MKCHRPAAASLIAILASACTSPTIRQPAPPTINYRLNGPLIPAKRTMATAWDVPRDPTTDPSLDDSKLSQDVRWGYRIFVDTPTEVPRFAPGRGSCNNCHLNAGQRERAMPLVNIAAVFPEYNRRLGRLISLADRVVECFLRSQNATGAPHAPEDADARAESLPQPVSKEVLAVSAYLTWLSRGGEMGRNPPWRGQNAIAANAIIPLNKLDPKKGEALFNDRCTTCHGVDGQGVTIGTKRPGPLWGPDSWNDGAGAARIYTLAGIIRYTMPYLDPGSLTDEEAQLVAAYINSQPRPAYPFKDQDYRTDPLPADAVYYAKRP